MRILLHARIFLLMSLLSFPSFAQKLNQTAIVTCEDIYGRCVGGCNETATFQNCTQDFKGCMDQNAYLAPQKPLECFRSEASWQAAYFAIGTTAGIMAFGYGLMPAILKGISGFINYTKRSCPGTNKCLIFFTDLDGDGVIKPNELIQPAILISAISIGGALGAYQDSIKAQAECDFALVQKPKGE